MQTLVHIACYTWMIVFLIDDSEDTDIDQTYSAVIFHSWNNEHTYYFDTRMSHAPCKPK